MRAMNMQGLPINFEGLDKEALEENKKNATK